jgi:hypothetical protein
VYIERERIRERAPPPPSPPMEEYETFRYVPGVGQRRRESAGYDEEARVSTKRVVERERVRPVDAEGRIRDYNGRY